MNYLLKTVFTEKDLYAWNLKYTYEAIFNTDWIS